MHIYTQIYVDTHTHVQTQKMYKSSKRCTQEAKDVQKKQKMYKRRKRCTKEAKDVHVESFWKGFYDVVRSGS